MHEGGTPFFNVAHTVSDNYIIPTQRPFAVLPTAVVNGQPIDGDRGRGEILMSVNFNRV